MRSWQVGRVNATAQRSDLRCEGGERDAHGTNVAQIVINQTANHSGVDSPPRLHEDQGLVQCDDEVRP
jgi:hypothetical protein